VVALLVALNAAAPADDNGMTVGAGKLENLLHSHRDAVIDEVERAGQAEPSVRPRPVLPLDKSRQPHQVHEDAPPSLDGQPDNQSLRRIHLAQSERAIAV